ncbi:phosphatase PAP2 family protein [Flavobacteriaceae bacterium Ap0902]|nr:phosphatase PAP2 family protein [Flavobacteriaceae bacterium Ap0902]
MMDKKDFIYRTWPFLLIGFIYILVGMSLTKYYGTDNLHILLNTYHAPLADIFFRYFTRTGEALFGIIILIACLWWMRYRDLMVILSSSVLQFIIVMGLKRTFFIHHLRPAYYFKEKEISLHLVENFKQSITFTYPSGHAATAFMLFLFLALLTKNRWLQLVLGLISVLTACSRIYLSQHFVEDTVAGALIGMLVVIVSYYLIYFREFPWMKKYVIKRSA